MHFIENSLNSIHQLWALGTWKPIQARCLMPQGGNEMIISSWIALENNFQYLTFLRKFKFCSWLFCAAWTSWGVGFALVCIGERLGQRIWSENPWIDEKDIWFSSHNFSNLFQTYLVSIISNHHNSFHIWLYTKS